MRRSIAALFAVVLSLLPLAMARAEPVVHAVLVGVTEYPSLDRRLQLRGPKNDVGLFYDLLLARKVPAANILVLADGVTLPGATLPTRAAILSALDQTENALRQQPDKEHFVFLFLAGHGSQMPAKPGDVKEPDGLDEIFLPRDVGRWDQEIGRIRNAISDNEIGAAIDRLRGLGAFVWAVFDSCHAGTLLRSAAPDEQPRQVSPQDLGVPVESLPRTRGGANDGGLIEFTQGDPVAGGVVAFYAAQSHETTPEAVISGGTRDAAPRGVFSYSLQEVLAASPGITYRDAIRRVLQRYQSMGRSNPTPNLEGTMLDAPVFGAGVAPTRRQWSLEQQGGALVVKAGLLHQVTPGSILSVVATADASDDAVVGFVRVKDAGTMQSVVQPVDDPYGKTKASIAWAKAVPPAAFARPVDLKVSFVLRVAEPPATGEGSAAGPCQVPSPAIRAVIHEFRRSTTVNKRIRLVSPREEADVRLCAVGDRLLVLDASGVVDPARLDLAPGIAIAPGPTQAPSDQLSPGAQALAAALEKVVRVINLTRLSEVAALDAGPVQSDITVRLEIQPAECPTKPCARLAIDPDRRPALNAGDKVAVTLTNPGRSAVDVTGLYVDAAYGITALFPNARDNPRLGAGQSRSFSIQMSALPIGVERLLFLAVPASGSVDPTLFTNLAQNGLSVEAKRMATRGQEDARDWLEDAAFGSDLEGSTRGLKAFRFAMPRVVTMTWRVGP